MAAIPKTKKNREINSLSIPRLTYIRSMALIKVRTAVITIALFISLGEMIPLCKARIGPIRSSLSVPFTPSP